MLHGSILAICVAFFVMTPETCTTLHGQDDFIGRAFVSMLSIVKSFSWVCLILVVALFLSSAKVIGLAVKFAIESVPPDLIGCKITVAKAILSIFHGYVNVGGLIVSNPLREDAHWESKYLLKAENMKVKMNLVKVITSLATEFEIESVVLHGVEVCYEKHSYSQPSNVQEIIDYVEAQMKQSDETSKEESLARSPST